MTIPPGRRDSNDFRIFLSYRRDDAAGHAGRLHDALLEHFRREQIFMDIDAIEPGLDFVETIERALSRCDVLLVLIGPRWLGGQGAAGRTRLDDPHDFVRLEVQAALGRPELRVIPVLIQGAAMPSTAALPVGLQTLARRNALEVSDTRWQYDISQLIGLLKRMDAARLRVSATGPARPAARSGLTPVSSLVRLPVPSRMGLLGGLAAIGIVLAVTLGVMAVRPSASGPAASPPGALTGLGSHPARSASPPGPLSSAHRSASSAPLASSAAMPSVPSTSVPVSGAVIAAFKDSTQRRTAKFTVDESWSLEWTSENYFSVFVSIAENRSVFHLDGLREDGSAGVTPMYAPGTFYLTVFATGPWTVTIKDLAEWPRTTLPYSLTGDGSMQTPVFEQSGTTRVCWQSDGDSSFIVDLWSLSRRGRESAQSAVIKTGATEGCADLEARSKEGYLQVFTVSGTWTVSAQTR